MNLHNHKKTSLAGFSMIEMLVATVVFSIGVMGLGAMTFMASRGQDQTITQRQAALSSASIISRLMGNGSIDFSSGSGRSCAATGSGGSFGGSSSAFTMCAATASTKFGSSVDGEPSVLENPNGTGHLSLDGTMVYLYYVACQSDPTPGYTSTIPDHALCEQAIDVENGPFPESLTCGVGEVDHYIPTALASEAVNIKILLVYQDQNGTCHTHSDEAVVRLEDVGLGTSGGI